jgi:hypothetical protein
VRRTINDSPLGTRARLLETLSRFRQDTYAYSSLVLRIRDKGANLIPLEANWAQRYVEQKLERQLSETGRIRAIVLKARQEGVSTWTAARFFKRIHLQAGQKGLVVADSLDRAGAIFGIYTRFYENLPAELQPVRKSYANQKRLAFSHDSELAVRPASDSEAGRAQTIHCLHASELAYWPVSTQRETWVSLLQAIPDDGTEIIVESTAKGAGGLFHELWERSQIPGSGWIGIFLPWWIHEEYEEKPLQAELDGIESNPDDFELQALSEGIPYEGKQWILSLDKLAWRRRKIIEAFGGDPVTLGSDATREFQREYPATADEAFLMSGACYFDEDELRKLARKTHEPKATGSLKQVGDDKTFIIKLEKSVRGALSVYSYPDKDGHYVIGADTATGKEVVTRRTQTEEARERGGRDYSCAIVLRVAEDDRLPEVVAILHGYLPPDIFARQLELLGKYYSCGGPGRKHQTLRDPAKIMVESNHASGQRVLEYLNEILRYKNMYWQKEINTRTHRVEKRPGWRTDERTREILLDSLAETVRKAKIVVPDSSTIREMTTFVIWEDGKPAGEEGCHDDRVIALGLAHKCQSEHRHISTKPLRQWEAADTPTGL